MKLLLTGARGTVGPWVLREAELRGWEVVAWHREHVDPDDANASDAFLRAESPDAIVHLAMGAEAWAGRLAAFASQRGIAMVFTSTAMVFDASQGGPHRPGDPRGARDEYGQYKIRCEDAVLAADPRATIARIGWQIAPEPVGNNMLRHLDEQNAREGRIRASAAWRPACSFLTDTAAALCDLVGERPAGAVHLDSNAHDAWTFDEIVRRLAAKYERRWTIEVTQDHVHDQRLLNDLGGSMLPPLHQHLS
ncbi:sugar nucleotide-binding protein [Mitsuaria sp. GD03876]|uniref:sugar nucleotide-binding protein n=1 Tax=Mitsuaria sp. GD03876 TaxID=2975399 RepID=UPI00244C20F0|nr:sugar nucleotide-binding protein [Mitsuaria sp. GD03876]MDH0866284.1 sugar nucleotide-binding protein [Mitsuaria sp. GD03876]